MAVNGGQQSVEVEGFVQNTIAAAGIAFIPGRKISRENNDRDMPVLVRLLQLPAKFAAIHICQSVVQQDQVRPEILHCIKQPAAQRNSKHLELLIAKRFGNDVQDRLVIV